MPIHDWTRAPAGVYHDFHQDWTIQLRRALNAGILPDGYFAMADQRIGGLEPDVATLHQDRPGAGGGLTVAEAPPRLRQAARSESEAAHYARKANRIAIHKTIGRVVAMIEIVSPGNKDGKHAVHSFTAKAVELLQHGIHLLLIDPFPPSPRDPDGLPRLIWDELTGEPYDAGPPGGPLRVAAFDALDGPAVYVDAPAIGGSWPDAPLFLGPGWYVEAPLESTYMDSWDATPRPIRNLVEPVQ